MTFTDKYPGETLRALSWRQPFASLMLHGKVETRVWDTKYRGWVLICASKKRYSHQEIISISGVDFTTKAMLLLGAAPMQTKEGLRYVYKKSDEESIMPTGQAIAIGYLHHSREMLPHDDKDCFVEYCLPWEQEVKTKTGTKLVTKRRYSHFYKNVQPIEPFAWSGTQGWSTVSEEVKSKIILL